LVSNIIPSNVFAPLYFVSGYYRWEGTKHLNRPVYAQMHPSGSPYQACTDDETGLTCKREDAVAKYQ
jgi:hypothetical protein